MSGTIIPKSDGEKYNNKIISTPGRSTRAQVLGDRE